MIAKLPQKASDILSPAASPSTRTLVIEPKRGWRAVDFHELWAYRELFRVLAERDIRVRYKQTVLGFAWAILQPVFMMVIFSLVFGNFAKMPSDGLPYPIFTYAALLPWMFFANSVTAASQSLVNATHLVSKVYFPRLIMPLSAVGAPGVDFVVASSILLLMMVYYGVGWSMNLIFVPLLTLGVMFAALGMGTLLAALTTAYRDFRYVVPFMVQTWMFATPVAYPISIIPEEWRWAFYLNPMTGLIDGFRACFLGKPFNITALIISAIVITIVFILSIAYFRRVERRFADII
jgi:lipopolysaccharide transport system permease protein